MPDGLSLEDLSRYTGEPEERLREWRSRGLIGADGDGLTPRDLERVRLVGEEKPVERPLVLPEAAEEPDEHGNGRRVKRVEPRGRVRDGLPRGVRAEPA